LKNDYKTEFASVTNLAWKPHSHAFGMQNILISAHSNGELLFWHSTSSNFLKRQNFKASEGRRQRYQLFGIQPLGTQVRYRGSRRL